MVKFLALKAALCSFSRKSGIPGRHQEETRVTVSYSEGNDREPNGESKVSGLLFALQHIAIFGNQRKLTHHLTPSSSRSNGETQSEGCHCRSAGNRIRSGKEENEPVKLTDFTNARVWKQMKHWESQTSSNDLWGRMTIFDWYEWTLTNS